LFFGWPIVLIVLLRVFRWPQLVGISGLAVLGAVAGRGLAVEGAYFFAVRSVDAPIGGKILWSLFDPIDWGLIVAGWVLFVRSRRLAGDSDRMLPQEIDATPTGRPAWARALWTVTAAYACAFSGFVGYSRYQVDVELLQPGVDPQREQQALRAMSEGEAELDRKNLSAAEDSYQRSLRIWEELTRRRSSPPLYRANMALTLCNLGWIRRSQDRLDEAAEFYTRAVAVGDEVANAPQVDKQYREALAEARHFLTALQEHQALKGLDEKDRRAWDKYDESLVQARKGDVAAEATIREAIALWEEILPRATAVEYRKVVLPQLALAHLRLAELQQQGKSAEVETSLRKAIDYGEQALKVGPGRPRLVAENLELARQALDRLREFTHEESINRLYLANRFNEAFEVASRGIEEMEKRSRSDKDGQAAVGLLANRLDHLAFFLAHCPAAGIRDTKAAVAHANRAVKMRPTVASYWYTLAIAHYRNGSWNDSEAALAELKTLQGGLEGNGLFLTAMNLYQRKKPAEARAALRKAVEWMDDRKRQAEDDALLRFQFELMRPGLERLRREAESLLDGKDPSGDRIGFWRPDAPAPFWTPA
jgi:tetratricopeptide (TPR) repeat protein